MRRRPVQTVGRVALLAVLACAATGTLVAAGRDCRVEPAKSRLEVRVGTAGIFAFAGHDHVVAIPVDHGEIVAAPDDLSASSIRLAFDTAAIRVMSSEEPPADVPKVQEKMAGPAVLDVVRFPNAEYRSRKVAGRPGKKAGTFVLDLEGELTLRGISRAITAKVEVELAGPELVASGKAVLRQSDFGIEPVSVGGVVKVKDELALTFHVVAGCGAAPKAEAAPPSP